jgi:hypothetical protein
MGTIESKLTGILKDAARAASLELVTVQALVNRGVDKTGTWQVMDGLDTRLVVSAEFGSEVVKFTLRGQALREPADGFFRERVVFPRPGRDGRVLDYTAAYPDGDRLRKFASLLAELLSPYAPADVAAEPIPENRILRDPQGGILGYVSKGWVKSGDGHVIPEEIPPPRDRPGEDAASCTQAVAELSAAGLPARAVVQVIQRAYGHLEASFHIPGVTTAGLVAYDRDLGTYEVHLPPGAWRPADDIDSRNEVAAGLVDLGVPAHDAEEALAVAKEKGRAEVHLNPYHAAAVTYDREDGTYELNPGHQA